MHDGTLDATHAAFPLGILLERIDSEEILLEVRNMRKDEVGHDLEIGTHLGDGAQEHHALDAAKRMVADHHKAAFLGDVLQLFGSHIDGDVHVLQQVVGKLTALIISSSVKQAVDFTQTEKTIGQAGATIAEEALQAQGLFQILFCYYFSHYACRNIGLNLQKYGFYPLHRFFFPQKRSYFLPLKLEKTIFALSI